MADLDATVTPTGLRGWKAFDCVDEDLEDIDEPVAHQPLGKADAWAEMHRQMLENSLAFFASDILSGPSEAPYYGRFLVSEHHEEWSAIISNSDRVCVLAPRDHGKCVRPGTLILRADGKRVPAEEWADGEVLALNPEQHRFETDYSPRRGKSFKGRAIYVRTRTGREVEVTFDHPLRTFNRWTPAEDLKLGDRIAVPKRLETRASHSVPDAWLLGVLVGDGGMTRPSTTLTTVDPGVLDAVRKHYDLSQEKHDPNTYRLVGFHERSKELDLSGHTAHTKRVPDALFQAHTDSVAEFLSGYLDADAHVSHHAGGSVEFYSVSKDLLKDVQHLLIRLGVVAVLAPKKGRYKDEEHDSWRLTIRGKSIVTLAEHLKPRGFRRVALQAEAEVQRMKKEEGSVDLLPVEAYSLVQHSEDWFRKRGAPRYSRNYELTRTKALELAELEGNKPLKQAAESDVLWDQVVEIREMGEQEFIPITVSRLQNYVANDIVQHNTWFFDFAYPIWQAWRSPNKSGFIFSATKEQAARILEDIKSEIETNPHLQHLYPLGYSERRKWSSSEIRLANGHKIYARGFGTRVRGAHPWWIVCDDVLNDETAWSELTRTKQTDYFYNAVTPMCVPGGQVVVVGTPFHSLDLYGDLEKNQEYDFRRFQALDTTMGRALWPERYDEHRLRKRQREIGEIRFTREYQCLSVSDDMSLFPSWLFVGPPIEQPQLKLGLPREFWTELGVELFMGVDFAISSSVKADYTVIWVMGVDARGTRWIVDVIRERGLSYEAQKSLIVKYGRRYDAGLIFLESNQMQRIWGDQLIQETDLPIKKFVTTGQEKNSLEKGLPSLRVLLENKKFRIPMGDRRSVDAMEVWKDEMRSFTFNDGKLKSIGAHDDTVMACWICDQAIRLGFFNFAFGEDMQNEQRQSVDELINMQTREDTAAALTEFDKDVTDILEREKDLSSHVKGELHQANISVGHGEEDGDDEEDVDDVFSGLPLGANPDWRPKGGAPVPGRFRPLQR